MLNSSVSDPDPPENIVVDDEAILLSSAIPVLSEAIPNASVTGFLKASEAVSFAHEKRYPFPSSVSR